MNVNSRLAKLEANRMAPAPPASDTRAAILDLLRYDGDDEAKLYSQYSIVLDLLETFSHKGPEVARDFRRWVEMFRQLPGVQVQLEEGYRHFGEWWTHDPFSQAVERLERASRGLTW